jgi:hypothetical protein
MLSGHQVVGDGRVSSLIEAMRIELRRYLGDIITVEHFAQPA